MNRSLICLSLALTLFVFPSLLLAQDPGQADLDQATELQLSAKTLIDIESVIALCESALEKGLDEDNATFARQLLVASLWDHASRLSQSIVGGQRGNRQPLRTRDLALKDLDRLIEVDPEFGDAHLLKAKLLALSEGNRQRAVKTLNRAVEIFKEDNKKRSEALVLRSVFHEKEEKMLADLDAAIEADPENSAAWQRRAVLHIRRGQMDKAVEDFEQMLIQNPGNVAVRLTLAEALINLDKLEEAKRQVNEAIDLAPDLAGNYIMRAQIYEAEEKNDEAIADLDQAIQLEPQNPFALLMRARLHFLGDNLEPAAEDIDQLMKLARRLPQQNAQSIIAQAVLLRSMVASAQGRFQEAISDILLLLQNNPTSTELRMQLASLYVADQRPRKAIELLTTLIKDDEDNWMALRSRGDALLGVGKHAEAIEDYNRALALEAENDGILNNLAWVLATSPKDGVRDGQRTVELATKACELTSYEMPHILSTLAACYAEIGDFETAIKWSEKAVELGAEKLQEQIEQLKQELESYKRGEPWRELQEIEEKPDPPPNVIEA